MRWLRWALPAGLLALLCLDFAAAEPEMPEAADGATLEVVVRGAEDEPLEGAVVSAVEEEAVGLGGARCADAKTDSRAKVRLSGLRAGSSRYLITVSHPAYAQSRLHGVHVPYETRTLEVSMNRGTSISGRVEREGGQPVRGARVSLRAPGWTFAPPPPFAPRTTTDEVGAFVIRRVPPGVHGLLAIGEDSVAYRTGIRAGTKGLVVRSVPSATLAGRVERPVGERVGALTGTNVPFHWSFELDDRSRFRIPDLPPGIYRVLAPWAVTAPHIEIPATSSTESVVRWTVTPPSHGPAAPVKGRVVHVDGRPAAGARVLVLRTSVEGGLRNAFDPSTMCNARGEYATEGIARIADYPIRVWCTDGVRGGLSAPLHPGDVPPQITLDTELRSLRVVVRDAQTREPVTGARVSVIAVDLLRGRREMVTNAEGEIPSLGGLMPALPERTGAGTRGDDRTRFGYCPPGHVGLRVAHDPQHQGQEATVRLTKDSVVTIELHPLQRHAGAVCDEAGRAVAGLRVRSGQAWADTDDEGRFVLWMMGKETELERLAYQRLAGRGSGSPEVLSPPSEISDAWTVRGLRSGRLRVQLPPDWEGGRVSLAARPGPAPRYPRAFVDQTGSAEFSRVFSGSYELTVVLPGRMPLVRKITLAPAAADGGWRIHVP